MPHVVNGCGTWYYGKRNVEQHQGVCRACGQLATLSSYDTRLFVTILMIPVIPLGRKRIIEECGACQRHAALPLRDWQTASERAESTIHAYLRSPRDAALAREAMQAVVEFRNLPSFLKLGPEIQQHLVDDLQTMGLLAAGYALFARNADAQRVARAALETRAADDASDDVLTMREMLADLLLDQGKPDEAMPLMQHVIDKGIPDRVELLYRAAQAYQVSGNHERAIEMFQHAEAVNPLIGQDETFQRLRDESLKRRGTSRAVLPNQVVAEMKGAARRARFFKVAAVVVLLANLLYLALAWFQGTRRQVFVVNGLDQPYTVTLNGVAHPLRPHEVLPIRIAEGDVTVEMDRPEEPAQTVSVRTNLLTRPFNDTTFVINPDRTAIVARTTVYYVHESQGKAPDSTSTFLAGDVFYAVDGIDYPFEDLAESIELSSRRAVASRDALSLVSAELQVRGPALLRILRDSLGDPIVRDLARRNLRYQPEETAYLRLLTETMPPAELVEFTRPRLADRPLRIEWHRAYQDAMDKAGQGDGLDSEYAALLAEQEQANADLLYLASRVRRRPAEAIELLKGAVAAEPSSAYACYSLSGHYLENGYFEQAVDLGRRAIELIGQAPDHFRFQYDEALLAAGRHRELLESIHASEPADPGNTIWQLFEELYVLHLLNDEAGKTDAIGRLKSLVREWDRPLATEQMKRVDAERAYVDGLPRAYADAMSGSSREELRLMGLLTAGNLAAAEQVLAKPVQAEVYWRLALYLAAFARSDSARAEAALDAAIKLLEAGDRDDRVYAAALRGRSAVPLDELLLHRQSVSIKLLLVTAIGVRDPAAREPCFALAAKLNYDRRFPHLLVKDLIEARHTRAR